MLKKLKGYKAFHNMQDINGTTYEIGQTYTTEGPIKYNKNGFHFCENLVDILWYYDGLNNDIDICKVLGYGEIDTYNDYYYEYFNVYSASNITILKKLSREEIIDTVLKGNIHSIIRFVSGYKLTKEEIEQITSIYNEQIVKDYIEYYQYDNKEVFQRTRGKQW